MIRVRKTPRYRQIRDEFVERIASGILTAGAMLPSEAEIGKEFNVSPGTARKAMIELEQGGIVERRQGRGTFVTVTTPERARYHYFRFVDHEGRRLIPMPRSEVLERRPATEEEQDLFKSSADVFVVKRVRTIAGVRAAVERMMLPAERYPALDKNSPLPNAVYSFYQSTYGVSIIEAIDSLSAASASEEDATLLGIKVGTPLLVVKRIACDIGGNAVELRRSHYLTTAMDYRVTLR